MGLSRFILRAELGAPSGTVVSYAVELTACSAFVATDREEPVGTRLRLALSFPKLLERVELDAEVAEWRTASGPGVPSGMRLTFAPDARLTALLELDPGTERRGARACRILLVEDNGFIRDVFEHGVRGSGDERAVFVVDHAETVAQAWSRLAQHGYDLALVDYYLPDANGAVLIAQIRDDARLAGLPVVAMSVGGREARDASLGAGADLFLDKPLVFPDLLHMLRVLAQVAPAQPSTKKTILVFDDSPLILAVTQAALESAGFEVAIAEDLATFESRRLALAPDLILVDVQMPEAFGDDVVLTLREWHGVQVPIFLVSSLEEAELASRAARAHAAGYIPKGAGLGELVRRCKEALESAA